MKEKILKLRSLSVVFISCLLIYSCSKDSNKEDLVGTWTFDNATFATMVGDQTMANYLVNVLGYTSLQAQAFETLFNETVKQKFAGTFQVNSDNTFTSDMGGEADAGTWTLSSDRKTLTIDSDTGDPVTLDVIELTKSKLHVQTVETLTEDLNQDGTDETLVVTIDINFKK
jgi:hypothetical protein